MKKHTFTVDGLISGIIYSFENGWAYIRVGLKTGGGGGLKVGFYGIARRNKGVGQ